MIHIGMDVHKECTVWHAIDGAGEQCGRGELATREKDLVDFLSGLGLPARLTFEAGTSSAWLHRLVKQHGHCPVVVDPNRNRVIATSTKKTDRNDAATLATLGRAELYEQVYVRSKETDDSRRLLSARGALVQSRADLIRTVRSTFRAEGTPLPETRTDAFARSARESPLRTPALAASVGPMLETIGVISRQIEHFDMKIHDIAESGAEVVNRLKQIPGIGENIAVSFLLYVEDVDRFSTPGQVGAALGLVPSVRASAGKRQDGHITKRGKKSLRKLLVQGAWAHMRSKEDTALKRWTERLFTSGGRTSKAQKKKAITALARKMAELMWLLWKRGTDDQPLPPQSRRRLTPP